MAATVQYIDENGVEQTLTNYTLIEGSSASVVLWGTTGATTYYVVGKDYNNDGVINALDAEEAGSEPTSFTISGQAIVYGNVKLILADGFSLTVGDSTSNDAGIKVIGDNAFTVYGQTAGTGALNASSYGGAGIGGNYGQTGANITIAGGVITAQSSFYGAGIGGGGGNGSGTNIKIYGGTVNASGYTGAGIGGGNGGTGSHIKIYGGTVKATANSGAGIGGGSNGGSASDIQISGGSVYAEGMSGAGIGGGYQGNGSDVTISGGTVTAKSIGNGAMGGAGIGGGEAGSGSGITISGGTLTADSVNADAIGNGRGKTDYSGIYVDVEMQLKAGATQAAATKILHTTEEDAADSLRGKKSAASQPGASVSYVDKDGVTQTLQCGEYTLVTGGTSAVTWGTAGTTTYYVVGADYDGNGVINAADAAYAEEHSLDYAFSNTAGVTVSGNVQLILADGFSFTAGTSTAAVTKAGVNVIGDNAFTVYGQTAGTGALTASSGAGAGIGGDHNQTGTNITIVGGVINADSSNSGAGIGGGEYKDGTNIIIYGGTVNASGFTGAGIGGGKNGGDGSGIRIYGGTVNASANSGAGIGGGSVGGSGSDIQIYGGSVFAQGMSGAGIGGGYQGSGSNITISGGTVTAQSIGNSSIGGAGIGGGEAGSGSGITISGGTVTADSAKADAIGNGRGKTDYSGIYVNTAVQLKAGASQAGATEISHTTGVDVADSLRGKKAAASQPGASVSYVDADGETQTITYGSYTLIKADSASAVTWSAGTYVVGADYNQDGVINAADAALGTNAFTITGGATVSGDVKLIVADGFTLTVTGGEGAAGVTVTNADPDAATNYFTVYGQTASSGVLSATGGAGGAGIGGGAGVSGSHVTIAGGTVLATGGYGGAGIGGGITKWDSSTSTATAGNGTDITIVGGTVIARGFGGAGIGGGNQKAYQVSGSTASKYTNAGAGSDITISGGVVDAASAGYDDGSDDSKVYKSGAGIGGGYGDGGNGNKIKISGGKVIADGGTRGAGIGGGGYAMGTDIEITGGTVTATTLAASAIGGGYNRPTSTTYPNTVYVNTEMQLKAGASQATATKIAHTTGTNVAGDISGMTYAAIQPGTSVSYVDKDGVTQTLQYGSYTLVTGGTSTVTWGTTGATTYYVVGKDYNNDGVINALDAEEAGSEPTSFTISGQAIVSGNVKLILADGFSLTAGTATTSNNKAGINVTGDNTFTVYGQTAGTGALTATSYRGAGIGGNYGQTGTNITIVGGVITASSTVGAGIGGGNYSSTGGNGTNIKIYGGTVNAASNSGAGIGGGGYGGAGSGIQIYGGSVYAEGMSGAGIGGGYQGNGSNVTISGGTVTAKSIGNGAMGGAGIGGGEAGSGSGITISGGTVTADSVNADAIGNGCGKTDYSGIYVNTAVQLKAGASQAAATEILHATGVDVSDSLRGKKSAASQPGASISYVDKDGVTQTLQCGEYTLVTGGTSAVTWGTAGTTTYYVVGADYDGNGVINAADAAYAEKHSLDYAFTITGGATVSGDVKLILADGFSLTSTSSGIQAGVNVIGSNQFTVYGQTAGTGTLNASSSSGAGIGGNHNQTGTNITIVGGVINADSSNSGAGIGGGEYKDGTNIIIYGGTVNASGFTGAGIGGGKNGGDGSGIKIYGGTVKATTNSGAGIGGGSVGGSGSDIQIYGGSVFAQGMSGAGIGGGYQGSGSDITISGGTVTARSIGNSTMGGAGIGGGEAGSGTGITISGGAVTTYSAKASAMGSGVKGAASSDITADEQWTVRDASGNAIAHSGTDDLTAAFSGQTSSTVRFETTAVADSTSFTTKAKTYSAVSGNAFTVEASGVLNLANGVTFSGNTVAIDNAGTVNVLGAVTLATADDTITGAGTLNWDLTAGSSSNLDFSISDWAKVTATGTNTVTVASGTAQYGGSYALADNVSGDFAVTLTGLGTDYALSLNGTSSVTVGTTYYGLSKTLGTVSLLIAENKACGSTTHCDGVATRITDGSNTKMFFGGTVCTSASELECNSSVSIAGGTFAKSIASGSVASGCAVQQTGNLDLTIEGGTYSQRVAGGMYAADTDAATSAELTGNVTLNIKGGTFTGRIYGGGNAKDDDHGDKTTIVGDVNVTVDSSASAIYIGNYLVGGSRGKGAIDGSVTVTFTGFGSDTEYVTAGKGLTFGGTSVVAGGSNGDIVKIVGGTRTTSSTVTGSRNLVFDNFKGDFDADLRLFSTATFKSSSAVTLTDERVNLWTVETWNFEYGSSLSGLLANDFEGDRLNFDVTGLTDDWTVITGDAEAFDDLNDAAAVYFGDSLASFDSKNNCWTDNTYKLALNSDKTAMVVSKIA